MFVAEDEQHAALMRGYFIAGRGFDYRGVEVSKHWIHKTGNYVKARDWFCEEVKLQRAGRRRFGVILLIDEDGAGLSTRHKYVEDKLKESELPPLNPKEGRLLIIPVRNIETWMTWGYRWLTDSTLPAEVLSIDESADYKKDPVYRGENKADAYSVGKLMAKFEPGNPPDAVPLAMKSVLKPLNDFAEWAKVP